MGSSTRLILAHERSHARRKHDTYTEGSLADDELSSPNRREHVVGAEHLEVLVDLRPGIIPSD
jgi:hypothetical protein